MVGKLVCTLNSSVADVTYLFRIEEFPFFVVEFKIKIFNEFGMNEVQESVAYITTILSYEFSLPCSRAASKRNRLFYCDFY